MPEGYSDIQRDFKGLEKRAAKNLRKFNKGECKVQYERTTPCTSICCGPPSWKARGPGVLVDTRLEREPAVGPCSQEGELHPEMH